jgi:hypothetical protein
MLLIFEQPMTVLLRLHYRCLNYLFLFLLTYFFLFILSLFIFYEYIVTFILLGFFLGAVKTEGLSYPTANLLITVLAFSTIALDTRHREEEMFKAWPCEQHCFSNFLAKRAVYKVPPTLWTSSSN